MRGRGSGWLRGWVGQRVVLLLVLAVPACYTKDGRMLIDALIDDPVVTAVQPTEITIEVGQTATLTATADQPNAAVSFRSQATDVAVVTGNATQSGTATQTATVTGVAPGETLIEARAAGNARPVTARVTVVAAALSVTVSPPTARLAPGQTTRLACIVRRSDGRNVPTLPVTWSSSDPNVARVAADGTVTAVADGSATITCAIAGGEADSAQIMVQSPVTSALCAPQRSETQVLRNLASILAGDPNAFCARATMNLFTGATVHSSDQVSPRPRAMDHTTFHAVGGVPSWSLSQSVLNGLNTVYPCGPNGGAHTLCDSGASNGALTAGDYIMLYAILSGAFPASDATNQYQYGFVLDRDGVASNNFMASASFPNDYFKDTDTWYVLSYKPVIGWQLTAVDASNSNVRTRTTRARLIVDGRTLMLIVPRAEIGMDGPRVRFTAFRHDGNFGFNGNWDGDVQRPVNQALFGLPIQ